MDYRDFTKREVAYNGFVRLRREILDSVVRGEFYSAFTELCTNALSNDCIAQDVVAYFFNKGVPDFLAPNYDYYLSWQILAGANGNEFSLEKLEFFLNPALEAIIDSEEILAEAMFKRNINRKNALMVISNLVCEGMVDELKLNPRDLINIDKKASHYTPQKNRIYLTAMENCLQKVVDFLIS